MQVQVVAIVTVVVGLVGLCVVKEVTNPASHHHNINMALCREVFHYGVFDLPLPCRLRLHAPTVANLETEVKLGEGESYGQLEYLTMTTTTTTTTAAAAAAGEGGGGGGAGGLFSGEDVAFSNLYPAVMECFVIILCGYLAGRCNLISQNEAKGLNTFVGTFALPSLIFMSMAKLDFSAVNWAFLVSICVSKSVVFAVVVVVTLLVYKPVDLGKAGLYAIFCTQSNDFALGYPIVAALYGKTHPEFASYLYLVAPISLVLLNPLGFVLMEIGKRRRRAEDSSGSSSSEGAAGQQGGCKLGLFIAKDVFLNPIVLMTTLGIVGNFIFTHTLPTILEGILKVLGQSFSATALFLLGLRMVGKVQTLKGSGLVIPGILIATKTLILPLVTREVVTLLQPGANANETIDFSNYGFLYGTFPTAPGVFVFATQYNVAVDLMASAMVACTFLSAPLMFVSAKMVTLVHINPNDYVKELEAILLNVSIVGLVSTLWVLFVFVLSKKWRKVPHFFTMCLAISQCVACVGALLWSVLECSHTWKLYLQFILFSWGVFAARLWTAILAVTLFLLRWRSLCFVLRLRPFLCVLGWGLPAVVVTILVLMVQQETEVGNKHDPNFQYGAAQAIVALLLLWFSLFTTMVCLILHQRHEKRYAQYESLLNMDEGESRASPTPSQRTSTTDLPRLECGVASSLVLQEDKLNTKLEETLCSSDSDSLFSPDDDLNSCRGRSGRSGGGGGSGGEEDSGVGVDGVARFPLTEPEETGIVRDRDDEFQMMRHVVLLLLLCGSMIVGFALCMWTLVTEEVNGVYIELVFLDIVLNFGQGFFTAAIFGLDTRLVLVPLLRWWRRCRGLAEVVVPRWEELDPVTRQTCDQFTSYHMDKCVKDIVRDRRWRLQNLSSVFIGKELVDWLILVGLASDRAEAVKYGRRLLHGGIICHLQKQHHFHDQALFYCFRGAGLSTGQ